MRENFISTRFDHLLGLSEKTSSAIASLKKFQCAVTGDEYVDDSLFVYLKMLMADTQHTTAAHWVKMKIADRWRMLYCNKAYGIMYGIEPRLYIGEEDSRFWTESPEFNVNDDWVFENNKSRLTIEQIYNKSSRAYELLYVEKWPVNIGGKVLVRGCVTAHRTVLNTDVSAILKET